MSKVVVVGVTLVIFMGVVADAAVVAPAWSTTARTTAMRVLTKQMRRLIMVLTSPA